MRTKYFPLFSLVAVVCLLCTASCSDLLTGKPIKINGRTVPEWPLTKTSYSGSTYTEGGKTYERIDWKDGDLIKLAMNNSAQTASKVYEVYGTRTSGRYSTASLRPQEEGAGLQWGEGSHNFWAAYPSNAGSYGSIFSFSHPVPDGQTLTFRTKKNSVEYFDPVMTDAFMVAKLQVDPAEEGIVLDFFPAITTFEFTVGANTNIVIKSFKMETTTSGIATNVALSGTAVATFDPNNGMDCTFSSAANTTGQTLTASFVDSDGNPADPAISTTTSMNFKMFALPLDITGVRIVFTLSDDTTRSLDLKRADPVEWITFTACKKYNISGLLVPGAEWTITCDGPREERWVVNSDIEISVE